MNLDSILFVIGFTMLGCSLPFLLKIISPRENVKIHTWLIVVCSISFSFIAKYIVS